MAGLAILQGRAALSMALENFSFCVVVDWIEVRVTTATPTQARHIRARMSNLWGRNVFVHPERTGNSQNALSFRFRIQEPGSPGHTEALLAQVGLGAAHVEILAAEVAMDLYAKSDCTRAELAEAAFHLHTHQKAPAPGSARLARPDRVGSAVMVPRAIETLAGLVEGYTVHMGETRAGREDLFAFRWYVKMHDTRPHGIPHSPLPQAEHRARMEVQLYGELCPFNTLATWRTFRFETLSRYFAQVERRPVPPDLPAANMQMLEVLKTSGYGIRLGVPADPYKAALHRRQGWRRTRADSVLNRRIHDALRALTRATKRASA